MVKKSCKSCLKHEIWHRGSLSQCNWFESRSHQKGPFSHLLWRHFPRNSRSIEKSYKRCLCGYQSPGNKIDGFLGVKKCVPGSYFLEKSIFVRNQFIFIYYRENWRHISGLLRPFCRGLRVLFILHAPFMQETWNTYHTRTGAVTVRLSTGILKKIDIDCLFGQGRGFWHH